MRHSLGVAHSFSPLHSPKPQIMTAGPELGLRESGILAAHHSSMTRAPDADSDRPPSTTPPASDRRSCVRQGLGARRCACDTLPSASWNGQVELSRAGPAVAHLNLFLCHMPDARVPGLSETDHTGLGCKQTEGQTPGCYLLGLVRPRQSACHAVGVRL
jgi:hypothetical protein